MDKQLLKNYAKLIVETGVNLQKGQEVVIAVDVKDSDFAALVAEAAYDAGAGNVSLNWRDERITKLKYIRADEKVFDEVPTWLPEFFKYYDDRKACYINIIAEDPDLLSEVSAERIKRWSISSGKALTNHRKATMESHVRWTVVALPSKSWARKVFPGLSEEEAVAKLWDAIIISSRVDNDDPGAAWKSHIADFDKRLEFLNSKKFKFLKYKNKLGTDITVELPENHVWMGGAEKCSDGKFFCANIPTEEVFTLPKKTGVNGKIVASMPLSYNGVTIENFELILKDGKVIEFKAEKNEATLKNILDMDDGAKFLGEVALVPYNSPISNMKILFYNTLFDENASCHFAVGKAYPTCLNGFETMTKEELLEAGVNDSITHVDFMVGTSDLNIIGVTENGQENIIFENGNFAF